MGARTEAETFTSLLANLRLAEEACYTLGHHLKAQDDFNVGQGLLAVGEMLKMTQINVTNIATKAMRVKAGYS